MIPLKFFSENELLRASHFDPGERVTSSVFDGSLLETLDKCRLLYGRPIYVTSAYRGPKYNVKIGGVSNSSHTRGYAVDVRCTLSTERIDLVRAAIAAGFRRIGIGDTFIHLDTDPSKKPALWLY